MGNVIAGLKQSAAAHPDKPAAIDGATRLTYGEVSARVNRLSNALRGLARGDRLAILSLNNHRFLELYYGAPQAGMAVVPINFRIPPAEVKYILDHSGARAVAVDDTLAPLLDAVRPALAVEHYITIGDQRRDGYLDYEALLAAASPDYDGPTPGEDDLLGLFYTSGTTAEPKGVMLTHGNMLANLRHSEPFWDMQGNDIYLHVAPMFHLADGAAVFSNTAHGNTHAFVARFDPGQVLEVIARERVTTMVLVPTMINFLLHHPGVDNYDLSSLRHITYGASPIAPDLLRRALEVFKCRFFQGYGLTEASPLLTVLTAEDHLITDDKGWRRLTSCGRPVPGVEVRVVKADDTDARPGEVGEIIARGPNIMRGYWGRPEETASALRDGWLHTGDLATVDEDGYLYLVDRKKDMIVTGGENVFSTEVEAAIYAHPAIREAAVIAIPDPQWGEAVHACVTLREGHTLTAEDLIEFCRDRLANYKLPRSVEILEGELPKSGTGKILKKQLRERHWKGQARAIS